jgi:hypothetical protein
MAEVKTICIEALERRCASGETGRIDFHRTNVEAQIFVKDRLVVHAQLLGLDGVPALFRIFDWGDAEVTWNPGIECEQPSLHLEAQQASILYAEHLQERAGLEAQELERLNEAFSTSSLVSAYESVLQHYNIRLECLETSLLPDGFNFSDASKSSYVIGSADTCDVILRHPSVDPMHCGLILEAGSVYVWDLGSQAGIKLNEVPTAEGKLKVGDIMTLGAVDLRVRFLLRRPNIKRPATQPLPQANRTQRVGPPSQEIPKGPITFEKVNRQLQGGKSGSLFSKLFGHKDKK